jgi:replicative DNA helicase
VTARTLPHDLAAEASVLGAMLISRDAILAAAEICGPDDFYKPAHGHLFGAIVRLEAKGEPADSVTVADELRRANLLDAVGGPSVFVSLQANTPAIGNAPRYARIVADLAVLRRLVGTAGELSELGYTPTDDVDGALDRAEALVFALARRRLQGGLSTLGTPSAQQVHPDLVKA